MSEAEHPNKKPKRSILIVDDDKMMRQTIRQMLDLDDRCLIQEAESGNLAVELAKQGPVDVVFLDITMPGLDGFSTLKAIKQLDDTIQVIMVTSDVTAEAGFRAHQLGAFRYLTKPSLIEDEGLLLSAFGKALEYRDLVRKSKGLEVQPIDPIISKSAAMEKIKTLIDKAAISDTPVFITGESGCGKELIARSIHAKSNRGKNAFIEVNCSAIPSHLLENEFFGHEKGAFTDARERKLGKLELASEGTLFLDEIGTMPLELQAKLLRALSERRFERVGGSGTLIYTNARIISATNANLEKEIEAGHFRTDLYYRINTLPIQVPPLRERPEDIQVLSDHFLSIMNKKYGKKVALSDAAQKALLGYPWPGNVRQLQSVIDTLVLLAEEEIADLDALPNYLLETVGESDGYQAPPGSLKSKVLEQERKFIVEALKASQGSQTKAAELLQVDRKTLHSKIKLHKITEKDYT